MSTPDVPQLGDWTWGAEEVCAAVEAGVRQFLPVVLAAEASPLPVPEVWHQLPSPDAMQSAELPAVAISSPGLAEAPALVDDARWDAIWTVVVSVWARGEDGTYESTTSAVRRYTRAVRVAALAAAQAGGYGWAWRSEDYDQLTTPAGSRTLQAGLVSFDVPVSGAVDLSVLAASVVAPTLAVLRHTSITVTPKPPTTP